MNYLNFRLIMYLNRKILKKIIIQDYFIKKPTSSIRSFNTEVTTEPRKRGGCSA